MGDLEHKEIFIIKRHAGHDDAHHGGAWKIAFADFMTAMMALFLVLWLISSTSEKTKQTVAQYFNPVKLVDMSTLKKGFRDPKVTEMGSGSSPKEPRVPSDSSKTASSPPREDIPKPLADSKAQEAALFRDPYAVLAEIAARAPVQTAELSSPASTSSLPNHAEEAFSDPFETVPHEPDGTTENALPLAPVKGSNLRHAGRAQNLAEAAEGPSQTAGKDVAQQPQKDPLSESSPDLPNSSASEAAKLKADIGKALNDSAHSQGHPQIEVQETRDGILVSLTDDSKFSMFAVGSAEPQPATVQVMEKVGQLLKTGSGSIIIRGHTDGRPYKSRIYDNWRLSSARAQIALYMLARGGVSEKRIEKVEGYADHSLKSPNNPNGAENRRIEILLRKEKP